MRGLAAKAQATRRDVPDWTAPVGRRMGAAAVGAGRLLGAGCDV
jgi:hypothetical protein